LVQYLNKWLSGRESDLTPKTLQGYRTLIRAYIKPAIGSVQLQQLQAIQVEEMYRSMKQRGISNQTALHVHRMLTTALSAALRLNLVSRDTMSAVERPRVRRQEPKMWTSAQFDSFVESAQDSEFLELFLLAAQTGMRRSELCGLRWRSIDAEWDEPKAREGVLHVRETLQRISGKGLIGGEPKSERSKRRIKLGSVPIKTLKRVRARQLEQQLASGGLYSELNHVFTDSLGSPYDADRVSKEFHSVVKATKELPPLPFHSLRHLHAAVLIAAGEHIRVIAERLGHASTSLTADVYGHLFEDSQDGAAAAIDAAFETG
jgi:integrase